MNNEDMLSVRKIGTLNIIYSIIYDLWVKTGAEKAQKS